MSDPTIPGHPPIFSPEMTEYGYIPHKYVAIVFIVVFGLSTLLHIAQAIHYRMWWLLPTACLCGLGEVIGWAGRLWSSYSPLQHKAFMIQIVSLVVSPTPLIAVNFVLLGWIVIKLGAVYSWLPPQLYTAIFLSCDIIALLSQAAGGSIAAGATTAERTQLGAHIMLAGIGFLTAALITYCGLAVDFFVRYARDRPIKRGQSVVRLPLELKTKRMIFAVAFALPSIYRIIELASGWHSAFMVNETYFNWLDGAMVALALIVF
ncbi:RTA1-domain-containing protein [Favolaschia claudopus]|uniref:RTA1-domain-containing protein n=1 Tax=Favolaschia claudopus TaxID=2862362 RepID=A0AAW0CGN0_9AGAR